MRSVPRSDTRTVPDATTSRADVGDDSTEEDRRGPTALFWSNVNPYGTLRLDRGTRLDLGSVIAEPAAKP
jgi:hypothetical protein